jgi:glycosyltransferase involved in cell wall biosynthesis
MSRVSIGLPVYNGMPYLPDAIESLLAQDHANLEIVISDNASTDGTAEYCERISAQDPRVRYHRFDTNVGAAVNFRRCFDLSEGEYFAWAAHDDRLDPSFVSTCLAALECRPDAAMCTPAHRIIDESGRHLEVRREPAGLAAADVSTRLHAHLWRRGWLTLYGLTRRRYLELAGPPPAVWGSDVILIWRMLLLGPILVIDEPLADYRVFRSKTADSVASGITAAPSRLRWPNTRMRHALREAGRDLPISEPARAAARDTIRRWTRSHYFRQMAFADLYVEVRRLWSRGARARALALAPAMIALSPGMAVEGVRRQVRARRERIQHGDG